MVNFMGDYKIEIAFRGHPLQKWGYEIIHYYAGKKRVVRSSFDDAYNDTHIVINNAGKEESVYEFPENVFQSARNALIDLMNDSINSPSPTPDKQP